MVLRWIFGVWARLSEDCDDRRLAERFRNMAADLLAKADDFEELPNERVRHHEEHWLWLS